MLALSTSVPATAADEASIAYVQSTKQGIQLLVSVPVGARVDLAEVSTTIDDQPARTTATTAGSTTAVRRTTILAIDTSNSMSERFTAAKAAANVFLDSVPDDVNVGIVSFAGEVTEELAPTLDREEARAVIAGLQLTPETQLYDGVLAAVAMAGIDGQRTALVLSDGADTGETPLTSVTNAVSASGVHLDVVSLEQKKQSALDALAQLTEAGQGRVIDADTEALREVFTREADLLAKQLLVTVKVPETVTGPDASIVVTLPSGQGTLTAQAFAQVRRPEELAPAAIAPPPDRGVVLHDTWMYAGLAALGLSLFLVLVLAVPGPAKELSPSERAAVYTERVGGAKRSARIDAPAPQAAMTPARQAATKLLENNSSLEDRIAGRLDAAGSPLKAAEWLVIHTGIFIVMGVLGLLLGRGNLVLGILFMLAGALGPWTWLKLKAGRRRKAFDTALPDTLQLMSGSLAAGLSLAQSVDTIVKEGVDPIGPEFRRVLVEARLGVSIEDALEGVAERFDSKDFGWVVMAIKIQRQVGGNLAELLNTVAATMREREYMRRQVRALAAEGKLSAYVLGGLPPMFLLYLVIANRDYVMPLFTEPVGWVLLTVGTLILSVGVFWMSRLIKVEV